MSEFPLSRVPSPQSNSLVPAFRLSKNDQRLQYCKWQRTLIKIDIGMKTIVTFRKVCREHIKIFQILNHKEQT